ncbi:MAG: hypothetical protein N5P05_002027 [Chroococcopsis gigantea SAG 12.99]|nr:hypothetical protein [Chroococcopsis gigantea SAG 12.99]
MRSIELIGQVTTKFLRQFLSGDDTEGVARFLLDRLTGEQVTIICQTILSASDLSYRIKIKIPRVLVTGYDLPEDILTDEKTVHLRHAACEKPCLLLANTNDDQGQSLKDIFPLGAGLLKEKIELWVEAASTGLNLPEDQIKHWQKALKGLQNVSAWSLEQFANYVTETRHRIATESVTVTTALGWALPALRLPRDSGYFESIPEKIRGRANSWQSKYQKVINERSCFLLKQTPSRKPIEPGDLSAAFEEAQEVIPPSAHGIILNFIASAPQWNESARDLTLFEWETDNISAIFSGLKPKKTDIASATLQFYEDEFRDTLTAGETDYLQALKKRKTKEAQEEDKEFYDNHRSELEKDRQLKNKWDKFVYGQPIECNGFLIGLLQAFERLYDQIDHPHSDTELIIRSQKTASKSKWLEINADVGLYFCTRYRGMEELTAPQITWDTHWLFRYDQLLEAERNKKPKKYKKNESGARTALEIGFYIELHARTSQKTLGKIKLIWKGNRDTIGLELNEDLKRLKDTPFLISQVSRELVSKKGRLQMISLDNVATLSPAYRQDRGTLVNKYDPKKDIDKLLPKAIKEALENNRLSSEGGEKIKAAWQRFKEAYTSALGSWAGEQGIASPDLLQQCDAYEELLKTLLHHAKGDTNRVKLLQPILSIGCVKVERGDTATIIPPWHPLRLAAISVKARQVAGLLKHILSTEKVDFAHSRLFFSDSRNELSHPYYPEVCLGYKKTTPSLLSLSDTVNDYSLFEEPTTINKNFTNEDPKVGADKLLDIMKRYLELLPHEKTNLSVIIYECDSTRLPQAVVTKLNELQGDYKDIRCQVILTHREYEKLSPLYEQLLQSSEADQEEFIASEAEIDFMARLRISVMPNKTLLESTEKEADIVFLQDIISRRAETIWQSAPLPDSNPDILKHVPSRWSKKRPAAKDDLKSSAYLVCPCQPSVGHTYLNAIYSVVKGEDYRENQYYLPARQISFQNEYISSVFQEVHRLGQWVVNYDDLLDKWQLLNQGVNVIRYQQNRTDGRNFLISSQAPLSLLQVFVKRRLELLNLGLDTIAINALARQFIQEANVVSGDILLRAAKSGKFAAELIGVVLSKSLLASELGNKHPIGWYFLDDYANWLGQKEGRIADILAISPQIIEGKPVLKIIISEAKYIEANALNDGRKHSQAQLRETVDRLVNALLISPGRLDRDLWLARLGDLLLHGIRFNSTTNIALQEWSRGIREGTIPLDIRGYSHVFISGPGDTPVSSDRYPIPKVDRCYQEIFNRESVRQLILAIHHQQPLASIREQLAHDRPWTIAEPRLPAESPVWVSPVLVTPTNNISYLPVTPPQKTKNVQTLRVAEKSSSGYSPEKHPARLHWASPSLAGWIEGANEIKDGDTESQQWLTQTVSAFRQALMSYDLQAKVLGERLTPNVALIRFQGSDRLSIKDVENRRSPLLTTHGLNVVSVLGYPGEIIISVARPQREIVSLPRVWQERQVNFSPKNKINLSLLIGVKEIDGELLYLNLAAQFAGLQQHAPHTLIAGATGSGKSVLLRNLLLDVCATNSPESVHIYLIDAKQGTDYYPLEELPHLKEGIITEQSKAIEIFESIVAEMERRYQKFREKKANNLFNYNQKVSPDEHLPVLLLVHDEFADWMLIDEYKNAISAAVQRLGVKARAAGIHLIFAAQRPDNNVFPMQLRDNLGNRLILKVESTGTSEISLGQKGAENLLGRGHLAAKLSGEAAIIYAQVPFISDEDFADVAEVIKQGWQS